MPYARQVSGADERMIVFGGSTRAGASDELWELDCSGGNLVRVRVRVRAVGARLLGR